ncbi:MAG TPA: hypothetical protein VF384_18030 [Planctomycetota bacterium]
MTFPDAEVETVLAEIAIARIDVDAEANHEVCRRLLGNEGIPTFVVLDETGVELHRWVGSGDAAQFLGQLRRGGENAEAAARSAIEHHGALAEYYLRRNDAQQAAEQVRAIERLDPERKSTTLENALWSACSFAKRLSDWPALRAAAVRYLALPQAPRAEEVRPLLGIAEFQTSGRMSPELQHWIDARLAVMGTPAPGSSIGERLQRWLGSSKPTDAVRAWVASQNKATDELAAVGGAAAASLRDALLGKPAAARSAGAVLARLHLPESTPWLVERMKDPSTPEWARVHVVASIRMHKEQRCLPALLAFAGEEHPAAVRAEAVDGIERLLVMTDGTARQDVADVIAKALASRDLQLLDEALQALWQVHAPMPLDRLLELLGDRRSLDLCRICDRALWILMKQLGMTPQKADGSPVDEHCSRELAAFLRRWYAEAKAELRWDAEAKCYRAPARRRAGCSRRQRRSDRRTLPAYHRVARRR